MRAGVVSGRRTVAHAESNGGNQQKEEEGPGERRSSELKSLLCRLWLSCDTQKTLGNCVAVSVSGVWVQESAAKWWECVCASQGPEDVDTMRLIKKADVPSEEAEEKTWWWGNLRRKDPVCYNNLIFLTIITEWRNDAVPWRHN